MSYYNGVYSIRLLLTLVIGSKYQRRDPRAVFRTWHSSPPPLEESDHAPPIFLLAPILLSLTTLQILRRALPCPYSASLPFRSAEKR